MRLLDRLAGRDYESLRKLLIVEADQYELIGTFQSVEDFDAFVASFKRARLTPEVRDTILSQKSFYKPLSGDVDPQRARAVGLETSGLFRDAGDETYRPMGASWLREIERQPAAVRFYFELDTRDPELLKRQVGEKLLEERFGWAVADLRDDVARRLPSAPAVAEPESRPAISTLDSAAAPPPIDSPPASLEH
jgi:hypothetical protein